MPLPFGLSCPPVACHRGHSWLSGGCPTGSGGGDGARGGGSVGPTGPPPAPVLPGPNWLAERRAPGRGAAGGAAVGRERLSGVGWSGPRGPLPSASEHDHSVPASLLGRRTSTASVRPTVPPSVLRTSSPTADPPGRCCPSVHPPAVTQRLSARLPATHASVRLSLLPVTQLPSPCTPLLPGLPPLSMLPGPEQGLPLAHSFSRRLPTASKCPTVGVTRSR